MPNSPRAGAPIYSFYSFGEEKIKVRLLIETPRTKANGLNVHSVYHAYSYFPMTMGFYISESKDPYTIYPACIFSPCGFPKKHIRYLIIYLPKQKNP